MHILLKIYIIQILVTILANPIYSYIDSRKEGKTKRQSIVDTFFFIFISFIPVLPIIATIGFLIGLTIEYTKRWVDNSPELIKEKNIIVPSPKKEKKFKPIKDRFDIIDL